ncbi:hypothetical protein NUH16_010496 [Penicillium rubens]|nr:hypothetical protein NUH16_010496 [Penicillium rubens]
MYSHDGTYPPSKQAEKTTASQRYPKEFQHPTSRDSMSSDHSARAILMGATFTITRPLDLSTYDLFCGPGSDCIATPEGVIKKFSA